MSYTVRVDTSPIEKGEEVKQLKARHRRRLEKEAAATPEYKELWGIAGARWSSVDKTRVKITAHAPDDTAKLEAGKIVTEVEAEAARREQQSDIRKHGDRNAHQGHAMFGGAAVEVRGMRRNMARELPSALPMSFNPRTGTVVTEGSGVHVEGARHFQVSSGMEGRGARGKSDLHGGAQSREPRRGALDLAQFCLDVEKQERLALSLAGKPGGRAAHKSAKRMRHAYEQRLIEHQTGGVMHRLNDFQSARGGRRSNEPKTEAVRVRARI